MPHIAKYEVIEEIGHGGMATVWRAHDPRLSRDVAIKVIHRHLRDSAEIAHRFFVEAKAVAKLRHPNIVEVYDVSSPEDEEQYLVEELVRGRSLRKILETHGALPVEVAVNIALELLGALSHAHAAGVIHRDIKPENVLIEHTPPRADAGKDAAACGADAAGERVKVKLTDFGIAKLLDSQGMTSTGQVLGSPAHMAPEQIEGGEVDARADVFGTGVLLYECLVGHLPFEGSNPAQVLRRVLEGTYAAAEHERPTVGKIWSKLLDRALSRNMDGRFQDANFMREALSEELRRLNLATGPNVSTSGTASGSIGAGNGRREIEAWFDDPEGYSAKYETALIARLCDLARASRARGDAVAAASDYNRALAYAPHDKALLRIVSTMHRSEARRRMAKRLVPMVLAAIVCGTLAFFAARAFKTAPAVSLDNPAPSATSVGRVAVVPVDEALPAASAPAGHNRATPVAASARVPAAPHPGGGASGTGQASGSAAQGSKAPAARDIVFRSLVPQFGVKVAVDSELPADAEVGAHVTLDGQQHVLTFTCAQDACESKTRVVSAGEGSVELDVSLNIKPATLVVQGDPSTSYTIQEQPTVVLRSGVPSRVPMRGAKTSVHVLELPSGRSEAVTLVAGQQVEVLFTASGEAP